mgnify:FL=1
MSAYPPPSEQLPIYNSEEFIFDNFPLTINDAKAYFLEYPNAQGAEVLQSITVNGTSTFNDVALIQDTLTITQPTAALNGLDIENDTAGISLTATSRTSQATAGLLTVQGSAALGEANPIVLANDSVISTTIGGVEETGGLCLTQASATASGIRITGNEVDLYGDLNIKSNTGIVFFDGTTQNTADPPSTTTTIVESAVDGVVYPVYVNGTGSQTLNINAGLTPITINPGTGDFIVDRTMKIQGTTAGARVCVGYDSGTTGQGVSSVAIGSAAATNNQGQNSVAIGVNAGNFQQSRGCVAVGNSSGQTQQSDQAIAIGENSGQTQQSQGAIAIGYDSGNGRQSVGAVAIGTSAGSDRQGANSIAIGSFAGETLQNTNSIVINATGGIINGDIGISRCLIAPIRGVALGIGIGVMYYDPITFEVQYSTT